MFPLVKVPHTDWVHFFITFVSICLFIGIAEGLRKRIQFPPEVTRKMVHILTGVLIVFTPQLFEKPVLPVFLAIIFISVNFIAVKLNLLHSIHGTGRPTYGTIFYPLSFLLLILFCWNGYQYILMISMLILAIGDALAAIVGENLSFPHEYTVLSDKKSMEGTLTMAISSAVITFGGLLSFHPASLNGGYGNLVFISVMIGIVAAGFEALSVQGSDNLSVPLSSAFTLWYLVEGPVGDGSIFGIPGRVFQFGLGMILALVIVFVSLRLGFFKLSGGFAAFLLAIVIFGVGGWKWAIPILTFFIFSSILSKLGKPAKLKYELIFEKSSMRDAAQVLANGGWSGIILIISLLVPFTQASAGGGDPSPENPIWYLCYLGTLAAVTADTWGTEIGILFGRAPRSIINFQKVETGTSGAVSIAGSIGGLLGSILIFFSGLLSDSSIILSGGFWPSFWIIALSGITASLVDSYFGATYQAQYQCVHCNKITEKTTHCNGDRTRRHSGLDWANNDVVNFICAISGSAFAFIGSAFFL